MHELVRIIKDYKQGKHSGIFSVCCSNKYVIEAAMDRLKNTNEYLLVESTANQVDQFGGYTGMTPKDYRDFIFKLCEENNFPKERIILGGDHLGPLTWSNIDSITAMENAKELIKEYVLASFTKIHIDTSMMLKGDKESGNFGDEIIAERAAELCIIAEQAYKELKVKNNDSIHPVYIIGSEVPIPGGAQEKEDSMQVTKVEDFENTLNTFKDSFKKHGLEEALNYVIGIVVQPGVEFNSDTVWEYDKEKAKNLKNAISKYNNIVFEAHSTDYQTKKSLRNMVDDGFIILKVGPALTFAFREAVFALNAIEEELLVSYPELELSKFKEILDFVMIKNPKQWQKHYVGLPNKIKIERKYSLSDRCRYYLPTEEVEFALNRLLYNLSKIEIPMTLLSQYMHNQYIKIREGNLSLDVYEILKDKIGEYIDDYIYAIE